MERCTQNLTQELQKLIKEGKYGLNPVLAHAFAINAHILGASATENIWTFPFPIPECDEYLLLCLSQQSTLCLFKAAYEGSIFIESTISPGKLDQCIIVQIKFYGQEKNEPLLSIEIGVDSMGLRSFKVDEPTSIYLQKLCHEAKKDCEERGKIFRKNK